MMDEYRIIAKRVINDFAEREAENTLLIDSIAASFAAIAEQEREACAKLADRSAKEYKRLITASGGDNGAAVQYAKDQIALSKEHQAA